jgi:class 3 adenylate cyclase/DNA-binding response OmpR family regulator
MAESTPEQLRVLVIDDSPQSREFVVEYLLKPNNFAVDTAADGFTGLSKALKTTPDLILLDYELPKMNGVAVLRQLRQRGLKTPVILMTSHGSEQLAVEVFRLGVQNYLTKPFTLDEARQAIEDAVRVTRLEKEKQDLLEQVLQANQELKQQLDLQDLMYQIGKSITLIHPSQTLERIVNTAVFLTNAEEGRLFLINPQTGQLHKPIYKKKAGLKTPAQPTRKISVVLEISGKRVGMLCVAVTTHNLQDEDVVEYKQMLRLLAGYANIALQNLQFINQIHDQKEKEKQMIRGVFERYVDAHVVEELLRQPAKIKLGGQRQPVTVLFADLRGFSTFAHYTSPEETVDTINCYIEAAVEAILQEKGTLDKFIGDAVMAFFNAPLSQPDHVLRAVRAALRVKQVVIATQQRLSPEHQLNFGLGVCVGESVVGNIGTPKLMNYTVIGDSVNKAKRLQEHAQGGQILISQETLDLVGDQLKVRFVGRLHLKGQPADEPVYEVTGLIGEPSDDLSPITQVLSRETLRLEARNSISGAPGQSLGYLRSNGKNGTGR